MSSPASTGSAAAKAAAAKSAESSAPAPAAPKAAARPASATKTSTPESSADPRTAPPPAARTAARAAEPREKAQAAKHQESKNNQDQRARAKTLVRLGMNGPRRGLGERDAARLRDRRRNRTRELQQGIVIIAPPQGREHFTPKSTHPAVRKSRLKPIAYFNAIAVVVDNQQDQHAAVAFGANSPFLSELDGEVFERISAEGMEGDYGDLGMCFLIHFGAQGGEFGPGSGRENSGKVIHVALRLEILKVLSANEHRGQNKSAAKRPADANRRCPTLAAKGPIAQRLRSVLEDCFHSTASLSDRCLIRR
jgi:hypothetical protein